MRSLFFTSIRTTLLILLLMPLSALAQGEKDSLYLFSYFTRQDSGLQLAVSEDGYEWKALNEGLPVFKPTVGDSLLRDPSIIYDSRNDVFHLVWTTSWRNPGFGYARSKDLENWTHQRFVSVKRGILDKDSLINAWAPEWFFDPATEKYYVIWASALFRTRVPGWYFQGVNQQYYMTTDDFENFTDPQPLFGNHFYGWMHIDCYIRYHNKSYYHFVKFYSQVGEGIHNAVVWTKADSIGGPFTHPVQPIPGATGGKKEAPCVIRLDDHWILYYDTPSGAAISKDLENWTNITGEVNYPDGWRHGTAIKISKKRIEEALNEF